MGSLGESRLWVHRPVRHGAGSDLLGTLPNPFWQGDRPRLNEGKAWAEITDTCLPRMERHIQMVSHLGGEDVPRGGLGWLPHVKLRVLLRRTPDFWSRKESR